MQKGTSDRKLAWEWNPEGAYVVTAAKSIQSYIFASDKLKEMVGASSLVEGLGDEFLCLLDELGLENGRDYVVMAKAAGSIRVVFHDPTHARRAASIWPMRAGQYAPGLSVAQGQAHFGGAGLTLDVIDRAEERLRGNRQVQVPLTPLAGPSVARYPLTGRPSVSWRWVGVDEGDKPVDSETLSKLDQAESAEDSLYRAIFQGSVFPPEQFPSDFEELKQHQERQYLAVIHADINGLGKVVEGLRKKAAALKQEALFQLYADFSACISTATRRAVRKTFEQYPPEESHPYLPARPLICAGDDLTLVMQAQGALSFVQNYLPALAREAEKELSQKGLQDTLPSAGLSAAAGVVFVKSSFPFSQSYALCEDLCALAKEKSSRAFPAVAFWRITDATAGGWEQVRALEARSRDGRLTLTRNPYALQPNDAGLPELQDLIAAAELQANNRRHLPRGPLRDIAGSLFEHPDEALRRFQRMITVSEDPEKMSEFLDVLGKLNGNSGDPPWNEQTHESALTDLMNYLAILPRKVKRT